MRRPVIAMLHPSKGSRGNGPELRLVTTITDEMKDRVDNHYRLYVQT